ncbi:MAG: hypothetical protein JWO09_1986 [Bacteroidetes bacterium]|nr:hypothetical protein [Bacteroidota bacterium]
MSYLLCVYWQVSCGKYINKLLYSNKDKAFITNKDFGLKVQILLAPFRKSRNSNDLDLTFQRGGRTVHRVFRIVIIIAYIGAGL